MWKRCVPFLLAWSVATAAVAADPRGGPVSVTDVLGPDRALTPAEESMLVMARKWQKGASVAVGPNGSVQFVYGAGQPTVVCAVLNVCDIELQPGETVNSINGGDIHRWVIEPGFTGAAGMETTHVIVKPTENNLDSSVVIGTTRRVYHIRLVSHSKDYMPRVTFSYPEDVMAKWKVQRDKLEKERTANTIPETGEYLANLDFGYRVSGDAPWKPLRVFNDGKKTIIQMPEEMGQTEAPVLLVVRKEGSWFSDEETVLMNYRLSNDRFIVDGLFERAVLVAGVGSNQDRITIERKKGAR
jgi:type IV secretion system protein TrbG